MIDTCSTPNESAKSNTYTEQFLSPCGTVPGVVTGLGVTGSDGTGVTLSWSAPSPDQGDLAGYEIERKDGAGGAWAPISRSPLYGGATTVKDLVTDAGTHAYFYQVRAFDSCVTPNYGGWSSAVGESFDPCTSTLPNAPTALTVTAADDAGVTLTWAAPSPLPNDLAGYEIQYKVGAGGSWAAIDESPTSGTATTVTHVIGTAGTQEYYYQVRAYDFCASKNYSPWHGPVNETYTNNPCVGFPVPAAPTSLSVSPDGKCTDKNGPVTTKAILDWTSNTTVPSTPAGVAMGFEFFACDTSGCTPAAPPVGVCLGASPYTCTTPGAVVVSGLGHGNGANVNKWSATIDMGAFLADKPYSYRVVQTYSTASCTSRSPMPTAVSETCVP